uniref:Bestrophin homolog n=1 Tax=Heterorhabditis bacteriophora TaxID=37862 RepID=A0A1I7XDB7_HETBA
MTVTYSLDVASSSFFCLYKLLFRWKGSIWKSVWAELLLWLILYATLSITYRFFLPKSQREYGFFYAIFFPTVKKLFIVSSRVFEDICVFFDTYSSFIPITFMLGFYVSAVFTRWWQIFDNIGWIDTPALWISQYIRGKDERARKLRRTCIRYLVLTQAMVFRDVSAGVRKRFPTMNHLVTAGLMTEKEMSEFDSIVSPHAKYWQPMHWVFSLVRIAREEGKIIGEVIYVDLMEKLRQFRVQILSLTLYDWVPVPLVYTQVVHLAVRSYFAIALLGRQYLTIERDVPNRNTIDLYVPIMSILQFIFFIGWMKVAEVLLNPLGEDDDDFECNYILDRNLQFRAKLTFDEEEGISDSRGYYENISGPQKA